MNITLHESNELYMQCVRPHFVQTMKAGVAKDFWTCWLHHPKGSGPSLEYALAEFAGTPYAKEVIAKLTAIRLSK